MKVLLTVSTVLLVGCGTPQGAMSQSGGGQTTRGEDENDDGDDRDEADDDAQDDSGSSTSGTSTSGTSTSGTSTSDTSTSGTSTSDTSTSDTSTSGTSTSGTSTSGTSGGPDLDCQSLDHVQCWTDIVAAWDFAPYPTPGMVLAYDTCYGNPAISIEPAQLIFVCNAEIPFECLGEYFPGCGEAYCECAVGSFPYDWTSCHAITMAACGPTFSGSPECLAAIAGAGCFPGATTEAIATCYDGIMAGIGECTCAMCTTDWSICDDTMNACLGL